MPLLTKLVATGWSKWIQIKREMIGMYQIVNSVKALPKLAAQVTSFNSTTAVHE